MGLNSSVYKKAYEARQQKSAWDYTLNRTHDNIPEYLYKKFETMAQNKRKI